MNFDIKKVVDDVCENGNCRYADSEFLVELTKSIKKLYSDVIIENNPLHNHYLIQRDADYFYITMVLVDANMKKSGSVSYTNVSSVPYGCTGMLCSYTPEAVSLEVEANRKAEECRKALKRIRAKENDVAYLIVFSNSPSINERKAVVNGKQLSWSSMKTENRNMSCFKEYLYSIVEVRI